VRPNQSLEILDGRTGELDPSHALELVKENCVAAPCLLCAELCTFVRAGDPVEKLGHVPRIWIGFVEYARKQRPSDGSRLQMHPLREPLQFCSVLVLECDVESLHATILHET